MVITSITKSTYMPNIFPSETIVNDYFQQMINDIRTSRYFVYQFGKNKQHNELIRGMVCRYVWLMKMNKFLV